jgi:hypothetical protein
LLVDVKLVSEVCHCTSLSRSTDRRRVPHAHR